MCPLTEVELKEIQGTAQLVQSLATKLQPDNPEIMEAVITPERNCAYWCRKYKSEFDTEKKKRHTTSSSVLFYASWGAALYDSAAITRLGFNPWEGCESSCANYA